MVKVISRMIEFMKLAKIGFFISFGRFRLFSTMNILYNNPQFLYIRKRSIIQVLY
jgi:hypothetical protein